MEFNCQTCAFTVSALGGLSHAVPRNSSVDMPISPAAFTASKIRALSSGR
jgi:hypothetical protein